MRSRSFHILVLVGAVVISLSTVTATAAQTSMAMPSVAVEARVLQANTLLAQKKYAEAQAAYRKLLVDPRAVPLKRDILIGLADACYGGKEFHNAAAHYEQALTLLDPEDRGRNTIQLRLGHSYYSDQKYARAAAAYTPLLQSPDGNLAAPAHYFCGGALQRLNRPAEAAPLYRQLVEKFPQHALASKAILQLGAAYADAGQNELAVQTYKTVLSKFPQSEVAADAQLALAEIEVEIVNEQLDQIQTAFDAKNWSRTIHLAKMLLGAVPGEEACENALYLLAEAKRRSGESAEAAQDFRQLIATYPRGLMIHQARLGLARALIDSKQWSNAESAARAGLAAIGNNADAGEMSDSLYLVLGEAMLRGAKVAEAAAVFEHVAASSQKELAVQGLYGAALAAEQQEQWSAAATKWGRYADVSADAQSKADAHLRQGLAWRNAKNRNRAIMAFDHAIAASPRSQTAAQARQRRSELLYETSGGR